jgi:hypothetical protein
MATLDGAVGASDPTIHVTGDTSEVAKGLRFRLDDELLELSEFEPYPNVNGYRRHGVDRTHWRVSRGVGGSVAAAHDGGTEILAAVTAAVSGENLTQPSPFAEGGGVQTVRLLGPFTMTFDADAWHNGAQIISEDPLPQGCLVLQAMVFTTTPWAATSYTDAIGLTVSIHDGPAGTQLYATRVDGDWAGDDFPEVLQRENPPDVALEQFARTTAIRVLSDDARIFGGVTKLEDPFGLFSEDDLTAGESSIYVLIAEPAA